MVKHVGRRPASALGRMLAGLVILTAAAAAGAAELPEVRVSTLQFGTVNWELDTIQHHGLDRAAGIRLTTHPVGSKNAAAVALQGGAADVIVSDWIWVSRQRGDGRRFVFYPWSMAVGSVMVAPDSGIEGLDDLAGRRVGVAGGPVDKSWLLLRALYRQRHGEDLAAVAEPSFGAPPLLNRLALRGDLPAVINFWHYSARLEAAGFRSLLEIRSVLDELGVERPLPLLGWVFHEDWARQNPEAVRGLLEASARAKGLLAESDAEWQRLRPLTKAEDDATLEALQRRFREGIPESFGEAEVAAARQVYGILAGEGGTELTGGQPELAAGTFWLPDPPIAAWPQ